MTGAILFNDTSSEYTVFDARRDLIDGLNPDNKDFLYALINEDAFWKTEGKNLNRLISEYLSLSGCKCSVEEFKGYYLKFHRNVPWYGEMKKIFNRVTETTVDIGIISNLCEMDYTLLKENLPMDKVNYRFLSFNIGAQKPYPPIYRIVETVTARSEKDILFFDDKKKNIDEAKKRNWNAFQVTGKKYQFIQDKITSFTGIHFPSALEEALINEMIITDL